LILQHDRSAGAGAIGSWLEERAIAADLISVPEQRSLPDVSHYALLVSLGSESCANDVLSWAREEETLLRQAHTAGVPVLGVCFGAQLLARALGGRVHRSAVREIGWRQVRSSRPRLVDPGPWFQWHFDSLIAPSRAEVIAVSGAGIEAFLWGNSLGLQFHPEVTAETIAEWTRVYAAELAAGSVSAAMILAATAQHGEAARRRAYKLLDTFAARSGLLSARDRRRPAAPSLRSRRTRS
jgi:GMP synthase-like glutamine amidotransferase